MKLSEAIILGSVSTTQRFDDRGTGQELCVIQTALYAISEPTDVSMYTRLWEAWPRVYDRYTTHPVNGYRDTITHILYSLNDTYRWPRPQIAEWVKTLEPNYVPTTQETALVEAA